MRNWPETFRPKIFGVFYKVDLDSLVLTVLLGIGPFTELDRVDTYPGSVLPETCGTDQFLILGR